MVFSDGPAFVVCPGPNQNIKLRRLTNRTSAGNWNANLWTPSAVSQRADHEASQMAGGVDGMCFLLFGLTLLPCGKEVSVLKIKPQDFFWKRQLVITPSSHGDTGDTVSSAAPSPSSRSQLPAAFSIYIQELWLGRQRLTSP